jgi:hypothetical protein
MKKTVVMLCLLLASGCAWAGPFGLSPGMTKEQIISLVGSQNVRESGIDRLVLDTVPQPNPDVDRYMCVVSPSQGLLAIFVDISVDTSPKGEGLKTKYAEILATLQDKYGKPFSVKDGLYPYVKAKDKQELYMKTLASEERSLEAIWTWSLTDDQGSGLEFLSLTAGVNPDGTTGKLSLVYYFKGMMAYERSKEKAKAATY